MDIRLDPQELHILFGTSPPCLKFHQILYLQNNP